MKPQQPKKKDQQSKNATSVELVYCFYDGASYSPGAYLKVDALEHKVLYCNKDGNWDLKDPPGATSEESKT